VPALTREIASGMRRSPSALRQDRLLRQVPPTASVISTFEFLAPLANRRNLYSLHHVYMGHYTLSNLPYPTPVHLDYIFMNTNDRLTFSMQGAYTPWYYRNLQALLNSGCWEILDHTENLLEFRKATSRCSRETRLVEPAGNGLDMCTEIDQVPGAAIRLMGFGLGSPDGDGIADLVLFWKKGLAASPEYDMILAISRGGRTLYRGILSPGSRIWPPQSWPSDVLLADHHRIRIAAEPGPTDTLRLQVQLLRLPP
jgi:hypothetical protein